MEERGGVRVSSCLNRCSKLILKSPRCLRNPLITPFEAQGQNQFREFTKFYTWLDAINPKVIMKNELSSLVPSIFIFLDPI